MRRPSFSIVLCAIAILFANHLLSQATAPAQAPKKAAPAAPKAAAGPAAMTNRDVIRLLQAKISEDIIITKIKQSKTRFDTSVDGLVALRTAGASDRLMALVMDPSAEPPAAAANAAAPAAKILPAPVEPA
jgi:hypothetical protein